MASPLPYWTVESHPSLLVATGRRARDEARINQINKNRIV